MPSSGRLLQSSSFSNVTLAGPPHFGSKATSHGPAIVSGSARPGIDLAAPAVGRLQHIAARLRDLVPHEI